MIRWMMGLPVTVNFLHGQREAWVKLVVLGFFSLAAAVMLYPLPLHLADNVPDWGDPLENAWVLAWDAHQLLGNPASLYQANIFYPYLNSLAFSESQVASALTGLPIYLASNNPILGYNFVFLLSFVLSGFGAYVLTYDLTRSHSGAMLAGFAFAFWPYRMNHLSHINLETLHWLPLVFFAVRRSVVSDGRAMPLLFAFSFVAQALSSWYAALMTGLGIGLYGLYYLVCRRNQFRWQRLFALLLPLMAALAIVLVAGLPYFQVSRDLGFSRSLQQAERLSATPLSFFSVPSNNRLYHELLPEPSPEALFPGGLLLALALVGAVTNRPRLDRAFWLVLVASFAIIALGPALHLSAELPPLPMPYRLLYEIVPGIQGTRAPARFFVIGMLGLCVLAGSGFARVAKRAGYRLPVLGALGLVALGVEYNVLPLRLVPIETGVQIPSVYGWLEQQPSGNVLELPTLPGEIEPITRAMYFSTYHWHALPLGYGSFVPQTQIDLLRIVNSTLNPPTARLLNLLRELDVKYLIFHRTAYSSDDWRSLQAALDKADGLALARSDDTDSVYEVRGSAPLHPLTFSYLLPAETNAGSGYTPYLVVQHSRKYPIVTADTRTHTLIIVWRKDGEPALQQAKAFSLPEMLRDRPEGVDVNLVAPTQPGTYQVDWNLDGRALGPVDGNGNVQVQAEDTASSLDPPIELLTYTFGQSQVKPGDEVILTLFWRRLREVRDDYDVVVNLLAANGQVVWSTKRQPVLWTYPTSLWRDGELVADAYAINVPHDVLAGAAHVTVGLTQANSDESVGFRDPQNHVAVQFVTGSLLITP